MFHVVCLSSGCGPCELSTPRLYRTQADGAGISGGFFIKQQRITHDNGLQKIFFLNFYVVYGNNLLRISHHFTLFEVVLFIKHHVLRIITKGSSSLPQLGAL